MNRILRNITFFTALASTTCLSGCKFSEKPDRESGKYDAILYDVSKHVIDIKENINENDTTRDTAYSYSAVAFFLDADNTHKDIQKFKINENIYNDFMAKNRRIKRFADIVSDGDSLTSATRMDNKKAIQLEETWANKIQKMRDNYRDEHGLGPLPQIRNN